MGGTYLEILCVLYQHCLDFIDLSPSLLKKIRRKDLHIVSKFLDRKNIKLERELLITLHICIFFNRRLLSCPFSGREKKLDSLTFSLSPLLQIPASESFFLIQIIVNSSAVLEIIQNDPL